MGVSGIGDYILISGIDECDYDARVIEFLETVRAKNIHLNKKKLNSQGYSFNGYRLTVNWLKVGSDKVM